MTKSVTEIQQEQLNKAKTEIQNMKDWQDKHKTKAIQNIYQLESLDIQKPQDRRIILDASKEALDRIEGKPVQRNINANLEIRKYEDLNNEELEKLLKEKLQQA